MYEKESAYSLAMLSIFITPGPMVIRDILNDTLRRRMLAEEENIDHHPQQVSEKQLKTERAMNYNNYY